MSIPPIHFYTTKHDLYDVNNELFKFARENGVTPVRGDSNSTPQIAVFVLSQYASDDINNNFYLTENQSSYIEITKRSKDKKPNDSSKDTEPKIYVFIRDELYRIYQLWKKNLGEEVIKWLKERTTSLDCSSIERLLEEFNNPDNNNGRPIIEQMYNIKSDFLRIFDKSTALDSRRKHALLLFLFVFIHENRANSNNWIHTFHSIVDLKANLKYALFPPVIRLDYEKALANGALPVLAVALQRFEAISDDRYELCFEVINAGKAPIIPYKSQKGFLEIIDIRNKKKIPISLQGSFGMGLPPILAAKERRVVRLIIEVKDFKIRYLLVFRFRCIQSFVIKNRFILAYDVDKRNYVFEFVDYKKITRLVISRAYTIKAKSSSIIKL